MKRAVIVLGLAGALALSIALSAQPAADDGPRYASDGTLLRPAGYREWTFLSSGLDMAYGPPAAALRHVFTNVFVNPSAYRTFALTGTWPERTMLVLEARAAQGEGSINRAGSFQTDLTGLEAHVKDARFPGGWAFYDLSTAAAAAPLAGDRVARCVECHTQNAAVDTTFVQFYPTLLAIARQRGTLKPGF